MNGPNEFSVTGSLATWNRTPLEFAHNAHFERAYVATLRSFLRRHDKRG